MVGNRRRCLQEGAGASPRASEGARQHGYRGFLDEMVARRNRHRRDAVASELTSLGTLPPRRTTDFVEIVAPVTRTGGFQAAGVFYSAPSRLIGHRLRVHLYDARVEAFLGNTHVVTHRRVRAGGGGRRVHVVDYRHVIHALKRKPMALAGSLYRDSLFPRDEYRRAWAVLDKGLPRKDACKRMVALLGTGPRGGVRGRTRRTDRRRSGGRALARSGSVARPDHPARTRHSRRRDGRPDAAGQLRQPAGGQPMSVEVDVHTLPAMLTALRLPSFQRHWNELAGRADNEGWQAARFLAALAELELAERDSRRIQRHLAQAGLPAGKTLATFDFAALPSLPKARVTALAAGDWIETGDNLVAIGNSGSGKTHLLSAIGHALVEAGYRVLYTRTTDLVQRLQAARRDLALEAALAKLDKFDLLILDDITYAHKDQAETSVLFELIARRYEHRSLAIAANQPFSAWNRVFPDQAVAIAAIDRIVHHGTILEMNADSYRRRSAAMRSDSRSPPHATAATDNLSDNQLEPGSDSQI